MHFAYDRFRKMESYKRHNMVTCCALVMTLGIYLNEHVKDQHGVKGSLECAYCLGAFRWVRGQTRTDEVTEHRLKCMKKRFPKLFKDRLKTLRVRAPAPLTAAEGPCAKCDAFRRDPPRRNMAGRERNDEWGSFYEDAGRLPPFIEYPSTHVPFQEWTGLDDVCPILRQFERGGDYLWYHASVRAVGWKAFEKCLLRMKGVYALPHWCLCDGRKDDTTAVRHHRHMILVVEKGVNIHAEWKKHIHKVGKLGLVKYLNPIVSVDHLINTLYYVSTPKARCDGTVRYLPHENGSHYWIRRPMYPHAKVAMSCLVKDGLKEFVQELGKNRDPYPWFDRVKRRKGGIFTVPVEELSKIRGCVLPFAKHLEPSHFDRWDDGIDAPYVHLYGDRIMVLRENKKLLDVTDDEWHSHQVERGNCFLEAVHEEAFVLFPSKKKDGHCTAEAA